MTATFWTVSHMMGVVRVRGERGDRHRHPHVQRQAGEESLQLLLVVGTEQSQRAPAKVRNEAQQRTEALMLSMSWGPDKQWHVAITHLVSTERTR